MLAALGLLAAAAPLAAGKSAAEMVADAQPGFGLRTSACVFKCESGYHAALNKTSLRGTAARLAAAAGDETKFDGFRIMNRHSQRCLYAQDGKDHMDGFGMALAHECRPRPMWGRLAPALGICGSATV